LGLEFINVLPNLVVAKKMYWQHGLQIKVKDSHILSKSIDVSQLQSVCPYGKSTNTKSMLFGSIFSNTRKQHSLYNILIRLYNNETPTP